MKNRKKVARAKPRRIKLPSEIELLAAEFAVNPRKRRFYLAMARALSILTNDDMDRIEPLLASAIGRDQITMDEVTS